MSETKTDVGIIIPAYNEGDKIGATIRSVIHLPWVDQVLVVNDGSTDNTAEVASKAGANVLSLEQNRGKAYAMKIGYLSLLNSILVFLDGDIDEGAEQAIKLVEPLWEGKADAVIANFPMTPGGGGFGLVKTLSQKGLYALTGKHLFSVLSGQRAFLRSVLSPELFDYRGYGIEFGMTVDMLSRNLRLQEIQVSMKHRTTARDLKGFIHRYRQFRDILGVILRKLMERSLSIKQRSIPKEQDKL